jgi:hypothetical protein
MGFVVDKVTWDRFFSKFFEFSLSNIILQLPHIHSCVTWGPDNGPISSCSSIETQSPSLQQK